VLRARSPALRQLREATLARARAFVALPYDEHVAELLARARDQGRRAGAMDAIVGRHRPGARSCGLDAG
jgi:hypothetical protein